MIFLFAISENNLKFLRVQVHEVINQLLSALTMKLSQKVEFSEVHFKFHIYFQFVLKIDGKFSQISSLRSSINIQTSTFGILIVNYMAF